MDTLTHALSGTLLARGVWPRAADRRTLAAGLAAALPDADYALFWLTPLEFLNWHRGPTHSALLLPLWAGLLALALARPLRRPWRALAGACALGIAAHLAGDLVTIYGTQLFWPLSDAPLALGWSFDVNPYAALVVGLGCLAARRWPRPALVLAAVALAGLFTLQVALRQQALTVAHAAAGPGAARVLALPQPLSPTQWLLLVDTGREIRLAHLGLGRRAPPWPAWSGWVGRVAAGYRPADALAWTAYRRPDATPLAAEAWASPALAAFRRFAAWPALYRMAREGAETCVWFTELRHALPGMPPPFRQGLCRTGDGPWQPYRLRYFSDHARQAL